MWAEAKHKESKRTARYHPLARNGKYCQDCSMYRHPHTCTLVDGYIHLNGTCTHWRDKTL